MRHLWEISPCVTGTGKLNSGKAVSDGEQPSAVSSITEGRNKGQTGKQKSWRYRANGPCSISVACSVCSAQRDNDIYKWPLASSYLCKVMWIFICCMRWLENTWSFACVFIAQQSVCDLSCRSEGESLHQWVLSGEGQFSRKTPVENVQGCSVFWVFFRGGVFFFLTCS